MSANHLKTPMNLSLERFTAGKVADGAQLAGKSLPASVVNVVSSGIVEVRFEVQPGMFTLPTVTVPVIGSQYVRLPIQVGDKGFVVAADARLGAISDLGGNTPGLDQPGNLSALAFAWLGSAKWPAPANPNAVTISGPDGAVLQDDGGAHTLAVSASGINIDGNIKVDDAQLGFYGHAPASKPIVVGPLSSFTDPSAKTVVQNLINALAGLGLITNGTT